VNEAKLEVSRDVPIDLPGGPSEVVVVGGDPRIVELELAAQREHGHEAVCAAVDTLEEAERIAPEHLVLLGDAEARAGDVRNAGSVFVGPWSAVPAGDYATGGNHVLPTNGWARSVGGLGLETFLKPVTVQRLTREGLELSAADRRGARSRRGGCPRTRRRSGDERAGAGVQAIPVGDADAGSRRARGDRPVAGAALRPEHAAAAAAVDAARRDRGRAGADQRLPGATYPPLKRAIADYAGVDPENIVLGAGADDLILLVARAYAGPGDTIAVPQQPTYPLYRIAAQLAAPRSATAIRC
jgi:Histidinol dehydrogenase